MDIIVCIKRVVATDTRIKIGPDGCHIDDSGVQFIMAPYDEIAVEKAIQLRDAAGDGKVVVLTVGSSAATKELRTALAMGADEALHVVTEDELDAQATAATIHAALEGRAAEVLLFGKQASDSDDAAVGPRVAALRDAPCVAFVHDLEVDGSTAVAKREVEGVTEIYEVDLPAVFTAQKGLAEPRYPSLKGIMAAKKKPLETLDVAIGAGGTEVRSLSLPPERGAMVTIEASADGMKQLLGALRNDKKVL